VNWPCSRIDHHDERTDRKSTEGGEHRERLG
jgi:hypothetical protein